MCTALVPIWDIVPISESIREEADNLASEARECFDMAEMGGAPGADRAGNRLLARSVKLHKVRRWLDGQGKNG